MMEDWEGYAILLSMMEIAVAVLLYYFSKLLQFGKYEVFAKEFLIESVLTLFLVIGIFLIIEIGNEFGKELNQRISSSFKNANEIFKEHPVRGKEDVSWYAVLLTMYVSNSCLRPFYEMTFFLTQISALSKGVVLVSDSFRSLGSNADLLFVISQNFFNTFMFIYLMYFVSIKLLLFFKYIFPVFIMIGVPLRAFEPTRSAGAYLIAVGLGFYFVYPAIYLLLMAQGYNNNACSIPDAIYPVIKSWNNSPIGRIGFAMMSIVSGVVFGAVASSGWVVSFLNSVLGTEMLGTLEMSMIHTVVNICFVPIIAFSLAMTFVNIGTTTLGGRIAEVGRGLFKFL